MDSTNYDASNEHLTLDASRNIQGQYTGGMTVQGGVRATIEGQIVGAVRLRLWARVKIIGQIVGDLRIDIGASLVIQGEYRGTLPEFLDGELFVTEGTLVNDDVMIDGHFHPVAGRGSDTIDTSRLFRLTNEAGRVTSAPL